MRCDVVHSQSCTFNWNAARRQWPSSLYMFISVERGSEIESDRVEGMKSITMVLCGCVTVGNRLLVRNNVPSLLIRNILSKSTDVQRHENMGI